MKNVKFSISIFLGLYLLLAVIFMIVPLNSFLLDVLITFNIAIAMIILFNCVFAKEALAMSSFPTILLLTTIFRISLNISSTRLILMTGNPGNVVTTFGQFVGGGNLIIGAIIFIVLVIVQMMVINKGSERVSEVTARFTLDAMPGKQMAIDADLSTGAISDKEAIIRRQKIQEEASFFGSMDGATKYVKGDATAGLIITAINFVGGILTGMLIQDLPLTEALTKYTILTIGDGLVSQLPSLMISLATGVIVTKASKEEELGDIVFSQLFQSPRVMYIVGATLIFLVLVTPLKKDGGIVIYMGLGLALIVLGRVLSAKNETKEIEEEVEAEEVEADQVRRHENVNTLLQVDPIELEFGYGIIPLADVNQGGDLLDRVVMIRRQIALELGAVVPIIRLRDNIQLNPNQYIIKIKGIQVSEGEILFDHYMAMNPGYVEEEITGIPTFEPSFHLPAVWITEAQRERAESYGYTVVDPPSIIATHLTEVIRTHLDELLTRQDVQNLINNIKDSNTTLVDELIPKLLNVGEIQKVLQNLLREGISIRDLVTIFEILADHAANTRDTDVLTEYVRQGLKRAISSKFFGGGETTSVVTLDPKIEQEIMASVKQTEQGAYLTLDPDKTRKILAATEKEIKKLEDAGQTAIVITSPIVRMYYKKLTNDYFKNLIVISYNEIESDVELQSVGMVTIDDN
ncbi:MAG: flagellar biosynthesis protein FlhA [Lachnospiraceae bacterium]|nr:flagellar biosynthesis protein FlhA [Lachnospiraceae bacterium]MBP3507210.1 flagellar biosynthesis protein FlhA [Lachnospiraceae bacterium]